MNDLERDLRELFDHDEARLTGARFTPSRPPNGLRGRALRRQILVGTASVAAVVALFGAAVLAAGSVRRPSVPAETVERSVNGVTIQVPAAWHVVDPVDVGIEPGGDEPPRLIAMVSNAAPEAVVRCPAEMPSSVLLTIQQEPLALAGEAAAPWPVELEPMPVEADAGCYAGWTFHRAGWTAAGRTFEARVGIGGGADEATLDALFEAFASMSFAKVDDSSASVVIASGTSYGQGWQLVVSGDASTTSITLDLFDLGSSGMSLGDADALVAHDADLARGEATSSIVYGLARAPIARVELTEEDQTRAIASADVIRLRSDALSGVSAFYVLVDDPPRPFVLRGYAEDGTLVDTWLTGGHPVETPPN